MKNLGSASTVRCNEGVTSAESALLSNYIRERFIEKKKNKNKQMLVLGR